MNSKIINVDIDDVVADFTKYTRFTWLPTYRNLVVDGDPVDYGMSNWFGTDMVTIGEFFKEFTLSRAYREMDLVHEDIPTILGRLRTDHGLHVRLLTARGARSDMTTINDLPTAEQELVRIERYDTKSWIKQHGIPYDELIFDRNKGNYAATIALDDAPKYIQMYHDKQTPVIVLDRLHNRESQGVARFSGDQWPLIGKYLETL